MLQKVDLWSINEVRSVNLVNHMHWNHFFGYLKLGVFDDGSLETASMGQYRCVSRGFETGLWQ